MSKLKNLTNCVPRRLRRELQHQQQLLLQRERRLVPLQLHGVQVRVQHLPDQTRLRHLRHGAAQHRLQQPRQRRAHR